MSLDIVSTYCLSILFFCVAFSRLKLVATARQIAGVANSSIEIIRDSEMDDLAKEREIQTLSIRMLKQFLTITFKCILLLIVSASPALLAAQFSFIEIDQLIAFSIRWDVAALTIFGLTALALVVRRRTLAKRALNFSTQYSRFDKALHRIAFGSKYLREALEDFEASVFRKHWKDLPIEKPVFVTSLPRAGTTILLECLAQDPRLVSHTYRDMPFVYSPVLWNKLSSGFRTNLKKKERAHGDGVLINADSPEAFEEVIWRNLTAHAYQAHEIALVAKTSRAVESAFQNHVRKILYLRGGEQTSCRYLSKNNSNISRIPTLNSMFADAVVLIPFRDPFEHAYSMWQQHLRFLEMHEADKFAFDYMQDLGHLEFGALHKPIGFPRFDENTSAYTTSEIDYWLAYWITAFDYLGNRPEPIFLSHETLRRDRRSSITRLREIIELPVDEPVAESMVNLLRKPRPKDQLKARYDPDLADRAGSLMERLTERCALAA